MVMKLREIKEVNAFLIVMNGNQTRFDIHLQAMIQLFKNIFSEAFFQNTAFVFTNWGMNKQDVLNRKKNGISEASKAIDFNKKLRELLFDFDVDRKCFYIDNSISILTDEEILDLGAEQQAINLNETIREI